MSITKIIKKMRINQSQSREQNQAFAILWNVSRNKTGKIGHLIKNVILAVHDMTFVLRLRVISDAVSVSSLSTSEIASSNLK